MQKYKTFLTLWKHFKYYIMLEKVNDVQEMIQKHFGTRTTVSQHTIKTTVKTINTSGIRFLNNLVTHKDASLECKRSGTSITILVSL